ncbi:MAG: hypothetical protein HFG65_16970 [Hungatella sp.]|nr:hypothetical protein [Hungatella sp.]
MLGHQKKITEIIGKKQPIVAQANVKQAFADLEKKFKYYRLSLYSFSLSTLMEIMLSGNFEESYVEGIKGDIREMTETYRFLFDKSSHYLKKIGGSALEANVLKGVGTVGKVVGKFIGSIPLLKEGTVDKFLQDGGAHIRRRQSTWRKMLYIAFISNPGIRVFTDKMEDMIQIYNHTE